MSCKLPPHPNLEYLRKQAKDLLHDMQQRDPAFKLADAQHTVAREYGFPSWPKLKAYVDSLPRPATVAATLVAAPAQGGEDDEAVPEKTNPFVGAWTANLSKSRQHPLNPLHSATLHFGVIGDTVTITDIVVDASGHEERTQNTFQVDRKEHPSEHGNLYMLRATWLGSHVLEAVVMKDGQDEGRVKYEVSADDMILTISSDNQVIVCDRQ